MRLPSLSFPDWSDRAKELLIAVVAGLMGLAVAGIAIWLVLKHTI